MRKVKDRASLKARALKNGSRIETEDGTLNAAREQLNAKRMRLRAANAPKQQPEPMPEPAAAPVPAAVIVPAPIVNVDNKAIVDALATVRDTPATEQVKEWKFEVQRDDRGFMKSMTATAK